MVVMGAALFVLLSTSFSAVPLAKHSASAQYGVEGVVYADITPGAANKSTDAYSPNPILANEGDTVIWTNKDSTIHTVTSGNPTDGPDGQFGGTAENPTLIFANASFEHTFYFQGTFDYYCTLHPMMVGSVIVDSEESSSVPNVTVATDKSSYGAGETVRISGNVGTEPTGQPILIQIYNPNGAAYRFDQTSVSSNGSFSYSTTITGSLGIAGLYEVRVTYSGQSAGTTFFFEGSDTTWRTATLWIDGESGYSIRYHITGGSLTSLTGDSETATVTATLSASNSGQINLQFPREVFDALDSNGDDLDFIAFVDDLEVIPYDDFGADTRTLTFDFYSYNREIDIVGTYLADAGSASPILSVSTDRTSYVTGDTVRISGSIGTTSSGEPVLVQIFNPEGAAYRFDQVSPSSNGSFSYTATIAGVLGITGTYEVLVSYSGETAGTTFRFTTTDSAWRTATLLVDGQFSHSVQYQISGGSLTSLTGDSETATITALISATSSGELKLQLPRDVMDSLGTSDDDLDYIVFVNELETIPEDDFGASVRTIAIPFASNARQIDLVGTFLSGGTGGSGSASINVSIDKRSYALGEIATVSVKLSGSTVSGQNVAVSVIDPSRSTLISRTLTTDSAGNASFQFRVANDYSTGTYSVTATASVSGNSMSGGTQFVILTSTAGASIVLIKATDPQGNPVSSFRKGALGYVKVVINSESSQAALATVNIFDSGLTSLGVGSLKTTLGAGTSETVLSFFIPADAASGQSEVFANLFSDWPSSGGIPLTQEMSIEVQIQ